MVMYKNIPTFYRYIAVLVLILSIFSASAQQFEAYRPVTAEELYAGVMEGGLASWVQDPVQRTVLSTAMATSYILGVANSTQNVQWCPKEPPDMQAISVSVLDYFGDLPKSRQSENAAKVIAEALSKGYPCP